MKLKEFRVDDLIFDESSQIETLGNQIIFRNKSEIVFQLTLIDVEFRTDSMIVFGFSREKDIYKKRYIICKF